MTVLSGVTVYAGQQLLLSLVLTDINGVATDPAGLTVTYEDQGLVSGPTVVTMGSLNHVGVGQFNLAIDTTGFVADTWLIQAVATGSILAVDVLAFDVRARPLG